MTRTRAARVLALSVGLLLLPLTPGGVAAAQSQAQEMLICHRTGSPTNPWVFMSIDANTWPEHEAQGDVRASSLADCAPPAAPAPAPAAPAAQPAAPIAQPAQPAIGAPQDSQAQPASSQVGSPPQAFSQVASPAESPAQPSTAEQARSTADVQAQAEAATPPVSSLPASGEPDRPAIVFGLLTLLVAGLGLRRLGRRHA